MVAAVICLPHIERLPAPPLRTAAGRLGLGFGRGASVEHQIGELRSRSSNWGSIAGRYGEARAAHSGADVKVLRPSLQRRRRRVHGLQEYLAASGNVYVRDHLSSGGVHCEIAANRPYHRIVTPAPICDRIWPAPVRSCRRVPCGSVNTVNTKPRRSRRYRFLRCRILRSQPQAGLAKEMVHTIP